MGIYNMAYGVLLCIAITGFLVLVIDNTSDESTRWRKVLKRNDNVVFAWHLAFWMVVGMIANYLWNVANGEGEPDFESKKEILKMLMPVLVAPIVFYPTWGLWVNSNKDSRILFLMLAFQNGFFWQTLFQKASESAGI